MTYTDTEIRDNLEQIKTDFVAGTIDVETAAARDTFWRAQQCLNNGSAHPSAVAVKVAGCIWAL